MLCSLYGKQHVYGKQHAYVHYFPFRRIHCASADLQVRPKSSPSQTMQPKSGPSHGQVKPKSNNSDPSREFDLGLTWV